MCGIVGVISQRPVQDICNWSEMIFYPLFS